MESPHMSHFLLVAQLFQLKSLICSDHDHRLLETHQHQPLLCIEPNFILCEMMFKINYC